MALESFMEGKVVPSQRGQFFLIEKPFGQFEESPIKQYIARHKLSSRHLSHFPILKDSRSLCFDIETCGLSPKDPLFAIFFCELSQKPACSCLFARDYSEEEAVLRHFFGQIMPGYNSFISYNGASFDLPRIAERAKQNGVAMDGSGNPDIGNIMGDRHIDLYPLARRKLRNRLPDAKLSTIEKMAFRYSRKGDNAGAEVPRQYKLYVGGEPNEEKMTRVISHGMSDTLTLVAVLDYLCH